MQERLKMTVEMEVTESQALALQAMFEHWNKLASWGSSRYVAFFVDGDGNFKPKCKITTDKPMRELTQEMRDKAVVENGNADYLYDFDAIAWILRNDKAA